jgi:hypothetical protein
VGASAAHEAAARAAARIAVEVRQRRSVGVMDILFVEGAAHWTATVEDGMIVPEVAPGA